MSERTPFQNVGEGAWSLIGTPIGVGERIVKGVFGLSLLLSLAAAYSGWIEVPEDSHPEFSSPDAPEDPAGQMLLAYYQTLFTLAGIYFGTKWTVESVLGKDISPIIPRSKTF